MPTGITSPPSFLDLSWIPAGGDRWSARRTALYDCAVFWARPGLAKVGLEAVGALVLWDLARGPGEAVLAQRLATYEKLARDELALQEAREVARRPIGAEDLATLQADLANALAESAWAFRAKSHIARGFAQVAALTPGQALFARALLAEALANVRAVDARLAGPANAEDLSAMEDDELRAAVLAACRHLTAMDGDRCQERNGMGWSAVASAPGHRLSAADSLTPLQARHARRIIFPHRAQLPEDLRERLFGEA
ncbi:hypothetical protein [Methylobacterium sp. Leaf469]|uniref:hypothetical protein n=1 Tax=Methylobacterium sp. Leaf469 TaxID=1736387 RepID=UPI000AC4A205|nr:hypothetical protein [Methylobacterium sp. Leaf469]